MNEAENLARRFHETYERLAPDFGYETRRETRAFDPESPNGRLMIAVCTELFSLVRQNKTKENDMRPLTIWEKIGKALGILISQDKYPYLVCRWSKDCDWESVKRQREHELSLEALRRMPTVQREGE